MERKIYKRDKKTAIEGDLEDISIRATRGEMVDAKMGR